MKAFAINIRNISLLLCGGLILTLYIDMVLGSYLYQHLALNKAVGAVRLFGIYSDVIERFVPALKS